jgi:hypothetical protein
MKDLLKLGMTSVEARLLSGVHTLLKKNSLSMESEKFGGMSRRSCLKLLLTTSIAGSVDVEQLLWTPKPIVVVSRPGLTTAQIVELELQRISPYLKSLFERDDHFYTVLNKRS